MLDRTQRRLHGILVGYQIDHFLKLMLDAGVPPFGSEHRPNDLLRGLLAKINRISVQLRGEEPGTFRSSFATLRRLAIRSSALINEGAAVRCLEGNGVGSIPILNKFGDAA